MENKRATRERLRRIHQSPPERFKQDFHIDGFEVETAVTAQEARELLLGGKSFDVLLLDLGLPIDEGDLEDDDNPYRGIEILNELRKANAQHPDRIVVGAVVGASAHGREHVLEDLIRTRMVDGFVRKPWDEENRQPFAAVVDAFRLGQQREWERYKQRRLVRWLSEAARAGVDSLTRKMTQDVSNAGAQVRNLMQIIEEEYHLKSSVDQASPVFEQFRTVREAVVQIAENCQSERSKLYGDETSSDLPPQQSVADLMKMACEAVQSGIASKNVTLDCGPMSSELVNTSSPHAKCLLEEILFGAIECSTNLDQLITTEMQSNSDESTVAVSVFDHCERMSPRQIAAVSACQTSGMMIGTRPWGLALAQYVAINIGGRLEIAATESGNHITLHLPIGRQ